MQGASEHIGDVPAAPTLAARSAEPGTVPGHRLQKSVATALVTFRERKHLNPERDTRLKEAAALLAYRPEVLVFGSEADRLAFAIELARCVPGDVADNLEDWNFSRATQLDTLAIACGEHAIEHAPHFPDVDWFRVYKNVAATEKGHVRQALLEQLPQLVTDIKQRFSLARRFMALCPVAVRDMLPQCGFSERQRRELALLFFSSPETCDTDDLDAFDLQDPQSRSAVALASVCAADLDVRALRKYILEIQPEEFALATLALAQMRLDQRINAGFKTQSRLMTDRVQQGFDKPALREELRRALKPFRTAETAEDLRQVLAGSGATVQALLGGQRIQDYRFAGAKDEKARLVALRNLVFFVEVNGYGAATQDHASADALHRAEENKALLGRLGPLLLKVNAIADPTLRFDLLNTIFSLPRRLLLSFDTRDLPVHTQAAHLLLVRLESPTLRQILARCADDFKIDLNSSRLLRLLLRLVGLDDAGKDLGQALESILPALGKFSEKETLESAMKQAEAAISQFRRSQGKLALIPAQMTTALANAQLALAAFTPEFEQWKSRLPETSLLALTRLATCLDIDPRAAFRIDSPASLETQLKVMLKDNLGVSDADYPRYDATFNRWRDPSTIPVYYSRIKRTAAMRPFKDFIAKCITQDPEQQFREERYRDVPVLRDCTPQQIDAWKANASKPIDGGRSLAFTDDPEDLMRMGSDFPGSCQKVDGLPIYNRALIGAVMDGRQKLVVIKAPNGKLIGRAIVRMMEFNPASSSAPPAPGSRQARLLLERIYPPNLPRADKVLLVNFALEQARRVGLEPVLSADIEVVKARPEHSFRLYSGPIDHAVYSDAASGLKDDEFIVRSYGLLENSV